MIRRLKLSHKSLASFSLKEDIFYVIKKSPFYGGLARNIKEIIDKQNIVGNDGDAFAKGQCDIVQAVSLESVLSLMDLDKIKKAKNKIKTKEFASKKSAETKKMKKRAKEIEKARKVLEEVGEIK